MMGKTETRSNRPRDGRHCDLCGCSQPAVRCDKCGCQIFCLSCDDMYHRHPKRRFHLRKAVDPIPSIPQARPVLPMKIAHLPTSPGDPSKMPLPPPRKKKPGKSFFDTFRRGSPSSDISPNLPKKEYSWTDRLGSIKKFMSNRPLPPLPNDNDKIHSPPNNDIQKRDLSFIHKRVDDRPPQLPQRSMRPQEFPGDRENHSRDVGGHFNPEMRNGTMESNHMNRNRGYSLGDETQWAARMMDNQSSPQQFATLTRQNQHGFVHQGGPNYPVNHAAIMHQSASVTDLHKMPNVDGIPLPGMPPPHYPHYPMNPHLPPHYPYPMYPQYPNYPQYFGNSFANLSNPPTTDGDFSDHSESSSRHHSGKKYPFRKRAKRSQSVMVDRMAFPGQFYPFGPFPPGYGPGPWGPPVHMDAPPSPASSVRSLNRVGRTRRRKKMASEDNDEEFSVSSSPMSRPKSSSSDRPPRSSRKAPLATQTTSSEENSENERTKENINNTSDKLPQRDSNSRRTDSPVTRSPHGELRKTQKQKRRETPKHSDAEAPDTSYIKNGRRSSRESNADQSDAGQQSTAAVHTSGWQCKHCTFLNPDDSRICQVCCKTASPIQGTAVPTSRPSSASANSRKQSFQSDEDRRSPATKMEVDKEKPILDDKQDMENLNSALDEAEKEISRGLEELMKLKEDFLPEAPTARKNSGSQSQLASDSGDSTEKSKPVYKSTGKMRTSILDKLNIATNKQPAKSTASTSTSTETQTGPRSDSNWTTGNVIETRRASNSSSASETFNSPIAQSPQLRRMNSPNDSSSRKDSSCQTQQDTLLEYIERKKAEEEAYFGRIGANNAFGYGDRMDTMTSPLPGMFDRPFMGGFGLMQRSHSRASLFSGRLNDTSPMDYGNAGFGFGPAPMYRSVSRGSLTGDYPDNRLSEFHNLRKPDYYLSMEELVERRRQETMRAQGLELVRMIREAEQQGFTAEDIQIALSKCGKQTPIDWLQENWRNMVDSVVTLSTNYGNDKKENDIGALSESEAREALRLHKGNIWAAVTECVEGRQRKFLELSARGKFGRKDIVDALTTSEGDVEGAYAKLTKSTSKPFLMRIWGAGEGVQNQDGAIPMTIDDVKGTEDKQKSEEECIESDEIWEEDVDWDDDDDELDEEEEADLNDLQQFEDDDYHSQEMKTPESDRSDYCDAFSAGTLERNATSPSSDDVFFVIPSQTETKKKGTGFLSKLASLRNQSKYQSARTSTFYDTELESPTKNTVENDIVEEANFDPEQSKNNGPFNILKSTISAIRDTMTGSNRNEKKLPYSVPERRTIIVKGQIAHEPLMPDNDTNSVVLTSVKPVAIEETLSFPPEAGIKKDHQNNVETISDQRIEEVRSADHDNGSLKSSLSGRTYSDIEIENHASDTRVQAAKVVKGKQLEKGQQKQTKTKLLLDETKCAGANNRNSVNRSLEDGTPQDSKGTIEEKQNLTNKSRETTENLTEIKLPEQNLSNKTAVISTKKN